jgi:hypothetical protein
MKSQLPMQVFGSVLTPRGSSESAEGTVRANGESSGEGSGESNSNGQVV